MANFKVDGNNIFLGGDISVNSGESLLNFFRNISIAGELIIIDLKSIETWDSSAIQVFLSWMKSLGDRRIKWKNMPEGMKNDVKIMGLAKLFNGVAND